MARHRQKKSAPAAPRSGGVSATTRVFLLAATWRMWLPQFLLIVAATLWIYWPALSGGFVMDDEWYITLNPLMKNAAGLWKFWFAPGSWVEYYPVQETLLWTERQLFGDQTLGYHLVNVALHILNAVLLWRLLAKLGLRYAWIGGLLFAIHPVQVETTAWISELKNTLSLAFFLGAMASWIDYDANRRKEDYQWALLLFLLAMLSKIAVAPFPVIILIHAWWKRGRVVLADLKASAPFFVVSVVLGAATIIVSHAYLAHGHEQDLAVPLGSIMERTARAGMIALYYFVNCLVPFGLTPSYPKWTTDAASPLAWLPWLGIAVAFGWAWKERTRWGRHAILGLSFFSLMIAPFIGFTYVSYMLMTWTLIHMVYIPIVGLIALFVAALGDLSEKLPRAVWIFTLGLVAVICMGYCAIARDYAGWFVDGQTLWTRTLEKYPNTWLAYYNLGGDMIDKKRYDDAVRFLTQSTQMLPEYASGYYNLGIAYDKSGRDAEAEANYRKAIAIDPYAPKPYLNVGEMMWRRGDLAGAEAMFRAGLKAAPEDEALCIDLGGSLLRSGRLSEAIDLYQHAVDADPDFAQGQYNLGSALMQAGSLSAAAEHLQQAVALDPKLAAAHASLGAALAQLGHLPEAINEFQTAIQIDPKSASRHDNLARALVESGHIPDAIGEFRKALEIDPNDATAKSALEKLQQYQLQHGAH